ncbi:hypothetical protein SETIT_6G019500v2 [Setaria italica]|uniref:BTB domain-containing protein n=1 Tax=Setaria italica TaxID=4555 RepID=A0A368RIT7_SETIT|nr:hypothetical protein SETIT_6G019500v2 [Setaria italica]
MFEIAGYSMQKGLGVGKFLKSVTFSVGGQDWCIRFYPCGSDLEEYKDYVSVYLELMLKSEQGADVTFKVEDQIFRAHKIVLAMRSPVFRVELYGPMRNKRQRSITVEDMQPAVFKALLHFIYTDTLPITMEDLDEDENIEMVKLLLVAADRLDVGSMATTLALADQHHCSNLKDACIQFINSSTRKDDLLASQGYEHLKRACPTIFVDIWER